MNRTVLTVLKAIAGLLVLFLLLYTVSNWWQEYRSEAAKPRLEQPDPQSGREAVRPASPPPPTTPEPPSSCLSTG